MFEELVKKYLSLITKKEFPKFEEGTLESKIEDGIVRLDPEIQSTFVRRIFKIFARLGSYKKLNPDEMLLAAFFPLMVSPPPDIQKTIDEVIWYSKTAFIGVRNSYPLPDDNSRVNFLIVASFPDYVFHHHLLMGTNLSRRVKERFEYNARYKLELIGDQLTLPNKSSKDFPSGKVIIVKRPHYLFIFDSSTPKEVMEEVTRNKLLYNCTAGVYPIKRGK